MLSIDDFKVALEKHGIEVCADSASVNTDVNEIMDSMQFMDVCLMFEEEFGVQISDTDMADIKSLEDLFRFVK